VTYALDASAIIAHLDARDAHHATVRAVLDRAIGERLLAHPLTIAECLVAAVRDDRGTDMVEAIRTMRVESVDVDVGSPLRLAELRVATGLRMPDCCALDAARHNGATFVTFDDRQAAAARKLGVAVEPRIRPTG
jgi:predicted nucleic acid-binding protein